MEMIRHTTICFQDAPDEVQQRRNQLWFSSELKY